MSRKLWGPFTLITAALACDCALGGEMYRWRDDQGRVHVSDSVPVHYRDRAEKLRSYDTLSPAQKADAQARRDSLLRQGMQPDAQGGSQGAGAQGQQPPVGPTAAQGASAPGKPSKEAESHCARERRLYEESVACFAPYRNVGPAGGIRAEAYQHCVERKDPSPRCGPPSHR
jgi:hypothetical protein